MKKIDAVDICNDLIIGKISGGDEYYCADDVNAYRAKVRRLVKAAKKIKAENRHWHCWYGETSKCDHCAVCTFKQAIAEVENE